MVQSMVSFVVVLYFKVSQFVNSYSKFMRNLSDENFVLTIKKAPKSFVLLNIKPYFET